MIEMIPEGMKPVGNHRTTRDIGDQSFGIYLHRVKAGDKTEMKKIALIKQQSDEKVKMRR